MAFDAPSREECTAERSVSNTPLQSLALLNDPTYVEAAKAFAARILRSGAKDTDARIDFAFREAFSRTAVPQEHEVLASLLAGRLKHFRNDKADAQKLLSVGIWKAPPELDTAELAAWTSVARALINKHEFVMRY